MRMELLRKLKLGLLTASAAGVLLTAQASVAQQDQQEQEGDIPNASTGSIFPDRSGASEEFDETDRDGDGLLRWQEIEANHGDEIEQSGWDRQQVFSEFDESNDQLLNAEEYEEFRSALEGQGGAGDQSAAAESQGEQSAALEGEETQSEEWAEESEAQSDDLAAGEEQEQSLEAEDDQQQAQAGGAAAAESDAEFEQDSASAEQEAGAGEQETAGAEQEAQQSEQEQSVAGDASQMVDEGLLRMSIEDLNEAEVVNSRGEDIGSVSRVVRNNETGDLALIVDAGGTAGVGGNEVVVPVSDVMQLSENRLVWETTLMPDQMSDIPEFDDEQYTELSEGEFETLDEANRG